MLQKEKKNLNWCFFLKTKHKKTSFKSKGVWNQGLDNVNEFVCKADWVSIKKGMNWYKQNSMLVDFENAFKH